VKGGGNSGNAVPFAKQRRGKRRCGKSQNQSRRYSDEAIIYNNAAYALFNYGEGKFPKTFLAAFDIIAISSKVFLAKPSTRFSEYFAAL
jgi:hypothetical protein